MTTGDDRRRLTQRHATAAAAAILSFALLGAPHPMPAHADELPASCAVTTVWASDTQRRAVELDARTLQMTNRGLMLGADTTDIAVSADNTTVFALEASGAISAWRVDGGEPIARAVVTYPGVTWGSGDLATSLSLGAGGMLIVGGSNIVGSDADADGDVFMVPIGDVLASRSVQATRIVQARGINPGGWAGGFVTLADNRILGLGAADRDPAGPVAQFVVMARGEQPRNIGRPTVHGTPVALTGMTYSGGRIYLTGADGRMFRLNRLPTSGTPTTAHEVVPVAQQGRRLRGLGGAQEGNARCGGEVATPVDGSPSPTPQPTSSASPSATPSPTAAPTPSAPAIDVEERPGKKPASTQPGLVLSTRSGQIRDTDGNGIDAGDTVEHTFEIRNTLPVPVTGLRLVSRAVFGDDTPRPLDAATCRVLNPADWSPDDILPAGRSLTCTARATLELSQAEADAGGVVIVSRASAVDPDGDPVSTTDEHTTTTNAVASLSVNARFVRSDGNTKAIKAGDALTYAHTITNSGAATLTGLTLTDDVLGLDGAPVTAATCALDPAGFDGTLAPRESVTCVVKKAHTVTAADAARGTLSSTVTASARSGDTTVTSEANIETVTLATPATIAVAKRPGTVAPVADSPGAHTATWTISVRNTGQTPDEVDVVDTAAFASSLIVEGASWKGATSGSKDGPGPFTLGRVTVPGGKELTWSVTVRFRVAPGATSLPSCSATPKPGQGLFSTVAAGKAEASACLNPPTLPKAALVLTASAALTDTDGNGDDEGDTIQFSYVLKNTGNVALQEIGVTDPVAGPVTCPATTLAPGATLKCAAALYTVTADDIAHKQVHTDALATASSPTGIAAPAPARASTDTVLTIHDAVKLGVDSRIVDTDRSGTATVGDTLQWTWIVRNTGSSTLTSITISDALLGGNLTVPGDLAPGAEVRVDTDRRGRRLTHALTEAEVGAGSITHRATVTAEGPGPEKPSDSAVGVVSLDTPAPGLTLVADAQPDGERAVVADTNGSQTQDRGDTITYRFTVTNTSATPLANVRLTSPAVGMTDAECGSRDLASGASTTCEAHYAIDDKDLRAGFVSLNASARADDPRGGTVTASDAENVPLRRRTELKLTSTAAPINDTEGNGVGAGDTVDITYTVTNAGSVALTRVKLTDDALDINHAVAPSLAAGESATVTLTHVLTQADLDAGAGNLRTTTIATADAGADVKNPTARTTTSIAVPGTVAVGLEVEASPVSDTNGNGVVDPGDEVSCSFIVVNRGSTTISTLRVDSDVLEAAGGSSLSEDGLVLAPGGVHRFIDAARIVLTADDIARGTLLVSARVTVEGTAGGASDTASVVTGFDEVAAMAVTALSGRIADSNSSGTVDLGDEMPYTLEVRNTSRQPLSSLTLTAPDVNLNGVPFQERICREMTINGAKVASVESLEPGAVLSCRLATSHRLTQAEVDTGRVSHAFIVNGMRDGLQVRGRGTMQVMVERRSALEVLSTFGEVKDRNGTGATDAGDQVPVSLEIRNSGSAALSPVTVSVPELGVKDLKVTARLEPGESITWTPDPLTVTTSHVTEGRVRLQVTVQGRASGVKEPVAASDTLILRVNAPGGRVGRMDAPPGLSVNHEVRLYDSERGQVRVGDSVQFTIVVTNTGVTDVEDLSIFSPMLSDSATKLNYPDGFNGYLMPGESIVVTSDPYRVTAQDVAAGTLASVAQASAVKSTGDGAAAPGKKQELVGSNRSMAATVTVSDARPAPTSPSASPGGIANSGGPRAPWGPAAALVAGVLVVCWSRRRFSGFHL